MLTKFRTLSIAALLCGLIAAPAMLSGADASSRATYTDANAGRSFLFFKKKSAKKTASAESQANDTVPASLKAYKSIVTDSATVGKATGI